MVFLGGPRRPTSPVTGEYPVYSDLEEESEPSEAELSYEDEDVEEEEVEEEEVVEDEEEEDDNRSAGTP